jgi:hypothetical protein
MDRTALPAELERALSAVHDLLRESMPTTTTSRPTTISTTASTSNSAEPPLVVASDLPWVSALSSQPSSASSVASTRMEGGAGADADDRVVSAWTATVETSNSESWRGTVHNIDGISDDDEDDDDDDEAVLGPQQRPQPPPFNRRQLELLAPLLDRLGRTLVDAAPHIASLAASLPYEEEEQEAATQDAHLATTISEIDSNDEDDNNDGDDDGDNDSDLDSLPDLTAAERHPHHAPLGGLLSILSRSVSRGQAVPLPSNANSNANNHPSSASTFELAHGGIDPDHVDYAGGLVNTSRGEVRSGPRSSNRSSNDDVASLLGAYLAAASLGGLSGTLDDTLGNGDDGDNNNNNANGNTGANNISGLGRLLRERGTGGGGGIDIHIHAVVTAPGVTPGGLGFATLGGGGGGGGATAPMATATPLGGAGRNIFASPRERSSRSILRASRNVVPPVRTRQEVEEDQGDDDESSLGLFSELYSENPTPVDPNGSPAPGERLVDTTPLQQPTDENRLHHQHRRHPPHDVDSSSRAPRMLSLGLRSDSLSLARRSNSSRRSSTERPRATGWTRFFRRRGRSNNQPE